MNPSMIEWAGRTDAGLMRENNEDAFAVAALEETGARVCEPEGQLQAIPERGLILSVADGVGGQSAGEVASALAVAGLVEELARFQESPRPLPSRECGRRLETAVRSVNGRIRQETAADPGKRDMAATLSCLWLAGHRGFFGQVGDSRLYRFRGGELMQLSHDQSEVGRAVRTGKISEADGKITLGRNFLDQALGIRDERLAPEIDWIEVLPGDVFLLCSDGLVDRLHDSDLADCLGDMLGRRESLRVMAEALMRKAEESQSRDNVTVLLVRTDGTSVPRSAPVVAPAPAPAPIFVPAPAPSARVEEKKGRRFPVATITMVAIALLAAAIGVAAGYLLGSAQSKPAPSEPLPAVTTSPPD